MLRRVAIYARVSTEHEAQINALENQIQYYDDKLKEHPDWVLYDRYIDEGITGTSVNKRKNFLRMIKDAERGCFDLIITREVSRFARNTVDTLIETRKLKRIGVEVYFTEDNIWTFKDEDGELKLTLMATLAQNESKKTSMRVKAGQKISFQNGVFYGTGNILGYDYNKYTKTVSINEEQAKVVRLIYKLFLDGLGTQKIKYELEKRGIPTATGLKTWNFATISRILQNSFYCGTVVYRKEYTPDFFEQKKRKNKGEVENIIVEGKHEPIISKEDFEKVQKLIKSHSTYNPDQKTKQAVGSPKDIWTKKLECECGSRMHRRVYSGSGDNKMYGYYCYKQKNNGSARKRKELGLDTAGFCDVSIVQEWKLDLMATLIMKQIVRNQARIKEIAFEAIDRIFTSEHLSEEINYEIKVINERLEANKKKKDKLLNTYIEELIDKEQYSKKSQELLDIESKLKQQLSEIENNSKTFGLDLKEKIQLMKEKVTSKLDLDIYNMSSSMMESLIDKVIVHNNKFIWKLNCISDIRKYDNLEEGLGSYFASLVITEDDIRKYNEKCKCLKKVFQKEPLVVDIYI